MTPEKQIDRMAVFDEMLHFLDAYKKITIQMENAAQDERMTEAENMLILRKETIKRIDSLQKGSFNLLNLTPEDDKDREITEARQQITIILEECREIEDRVLPLLEKNRDQLKKNVHNIKRGTRALKGYASASIRPESKAVYVEEKK